jgi:hypothetical protein
VTQLNKENTNRPAGRLSSVVVLIGGVLLVSVVGLLIPIPFSSQMTYAIGDLAHAPFFGLVFLIIHGLLDRYRPLLSGQLPQRLKRTLQVSVGLLMFGTLMEMLQTSMGRYATVHDAIANGLGIVAAVCWYWAIQIKRYQPSARWLSRGFLFAAGFLLAIAWWRPVMMLREIAETSFHSRQQPDVSAPHGGVIALQIDGPLTSDVTKPCSANATQNGLVVDDLLPIQNDGDVPMRHSSCT